ncbi:hypothetical protein EUGRSUZ_J02046 [Eucalyptus grandis]|uniref:Uncharacterized protein n=2 Tax=Eucalyptus grandis TaxID=71139 RepID=A0ACC3J6X6_EUCGR|nr:hypothetical protein EUGRSUZ_J02046 [Eucalyptus grandis]
MSKNHKGPGIWLIKLLREVSIKLNNASSLNKPGIIKHPSQTKATKNSSLLQAQSTQSRILYITISR